MLLEKRPQFGRQQRNGALHDEVMPLESPRIGAPGQSQSRQQQQQDDRSNAHAGIISRPPYAWLAVSGMNVDGGAGGV
jgi:hypothetical protein